MAEIILKDADVTVDGNNLSAFVRSLRLTYGSESEDNFTMGGNSLKDIGTLKAWSIEIEFRQDAAGVDAIIFPLVGTTVPVILKATSAAVSATNPTFTGTGLVKDWPPLGGAGGELVKATLGVTNAGDLVRAEA